MHTTCVRTCTYMYIIIVHINLNIPFKRLTTSECFLSNTDCPSTLIILSPHLIPD